MNIWPKVKKLKEKPLKGKPSTKKQCIEYIILAKNIHKLTESTWDKNWVYIYQQVIDKF